MEKCVDSHQVGRSVSGALRMADRFPGQLVHFGKLVVEQLAHENAPATIICRDFTCQAYTEKKSTWNMELKATSPAAYSGSPSARSFPHWMT